MNTLKLPPPPGASRIMVKTPIYAREEWGNTQLFVIKGETYFFRATGKWLDFFILCNPNGYDLWYLKIAKKNLRCRLPGANWFTLIGAIDERVDSLFVIGDGTRHTKGWTAPYSGNLCAFANDMPGMYWNNFSSIMLEVWQ
ncbi:hypothetical protein FOB24_15555 [Citrobacter werkmanii]|nr:hypothetical protein FOB24_15555 [Citrobacter werkmanii]